MRLVLLVMVAALAACATPQPPCPDGRERVARVLGATVVFTGSGAIPLPIVVEECPA